MGMVVERESLTVNSLELGEEKGMVFPPFLSNNFLCFEARALAEEESLITLPEERVMVEDKRKDGVG